MTKRVNRFKGSSDLESIAQSHSSILARLSGLVSIAVLSNTLSKSLLVRHLK